MTDCYYGMDSCMDESTRDFSSCIGCCVTAPPSFIQNRKEFEHFMKRWRIPYQMKDNVAVIMEEQDFHEAIKGYSYNDILHHIMLLGFEPILV